MKKLIEYIITSIVDHPEMVKIEETKKEEESLFKISVSPEDMGKVIGKKGKIIQSIRRLAYILAIKKKKEFNIELTEAKE